MSLNWIDVTKLSINNILLLESEQLSWLPGWLSESHLAVVLHAHPTLAWFMKHKCPRNHDWVDQVLRSYPKNDDPQTIREAEVRLLNQINDLLVYAIDPEIYDRQEFLAWDDKELTSLVDFTGKTVLDIGSGTGRLAFAAARSGAKTIYAVEPVGNLRAYLKNKAWSLNLDAFYAVDGIITDIPFEDDFADVVLAGHVVGDLPQQEIAELERVTRNGGQIILMPATVERPADDPIHQLLTNNGFKSETFVEPPDARVRKYWKTVIKTE